MRYFSLESLELCRVRGSCQDEPKERIQATRRPEWCMLLPDTDMFAMVLIFRTELPAIVSGGWLKGGHLPAFFLPYTGNGAFEIPGRCLNASCPSAVGLSIDTYNTQRSSKNPSSLCSSAPLQFHHRRITARRYRSAGFVPRYGRPSRRPTPAYWHCSTDPASCPGRTV